jgi:hypothetical protein
MPACPGGPCHARHFTLVLYIVHAHTRDGPLTQGIVGADLAQGLRARYWNQQVRRAARHKHGPQGIRHDDIMLGQ